MNPHNGVLWNGKKEMKRITIIMKIKMIKNPKT